jgi:hypothetical protein
MDFIKLEKALKEIGIFSQRERVKGRKGTYYNITDKEFLNFSQGNDVRDEYVFGIRVKEISDFSIQRLCFGSFVMEDLKTHELSTEDPHIGTYLTIQLKEDNPIKGFSYCKEKQDFMIHTQKDE